MFNLQLKKLFEEIKTKDFGKGAFLQMDFPLSMLNLSMSFLKSFHKTLGDTLRVISLPVKSENDNGDYLDAEETFYAIDAPTRYMLLCLSVGNTRWEQFHPLSSKLISSPHQTKKASWSYTAARQNS